MTLTEMLVKALHEDLEPESAAEAEAREWYLKAIKDTFKEWLKTVELGGLTQHTLQVMESTRKLLITLVDEP